jgi:hypothetical protein
MSRTITYSAPKKTRKSSRTSDPFLTAMWVRIRQIYFPERTDIDGYTISWSTRRQKRTLASCNMTKRRVVVARELRYSEYIVWLDPLLYHEMCHAFFGEDVQKHRRKRLWHGPEFRSLERRHPAIPALDAWIKSGGWLQAIRRERARSRWMSPIQMLLGL